MIVRTTQLESMKSGILQSVTAAVQDSSSTPPDGVTASASPASADPKVHPDRRIVLLSIAVLSALGALGLSAATLRLWDDWTDDPLRSIGMLLVPAGILLTLRVWRQTGWELRGTWWGLVPAVLGLAMSSFRHTFAGTMFLGPLSFNLFAPKFALYLFASGFVLLFAGTRVWLRAWFPLALLLCAQPVPYFALVHGDLPLQDISAHIARSFALLIGFPPSNQELLRLMFTPQFGMFIAPGCDGVRGALTLGYLALVTGYLKRVSVLRWISCVAGAVLLGYLFNLLRLCALVLYYRVAMGHPWFEHHAKQADYILGGCLFLIAALLFLWVALREDDDSGATPAIPARAPSGLSPREKRLQYARVAALAVPVLLFLVPGVQAIRTHRRSFAAEMREGHLTTAKLDALLPQQVGHYTLSRAWQELADGRIDIESGAYSNGSPDEATLGVWLLPFEHNMHGSWMARGEDPLRRADRIFLAARSQPVTFDTAFYSDGITDSIAANVYCTPSSCGLSPSRPDAFRFALDPPDFESRGHRAVPIFFRIDRSHTSVDQSKVFDELIDEATQFAAGIDFNEISRRFQ
jgi:exosortase J